MTALPRKQAKDWNQSLNKKTGTQLPWTAWGKAENAGRCAVSEVTVHLPNTSLNLNNFLKRGIPWEAEQYYSIIKRFQYTDCMRQHVLSWMHYDVQLQRVWQYAEQKVSRKNSIATLQADWPAHAGNSHIWALLADSNLVSTQGWHRAVSSRTLDSSEFLINPTWDILRKWVSHCSVRIWVGSTGLLVVFLFEGAEKE